MKTCFNLFKFFITSEKYVVNKGKRYIRYLISRLKSSINSWQTLSNFVIHQQDSEFFSNIMKPHNKVTIRKAFSIKLFQNNIYSTFFFPHLLFEPFWVVLLRHYTDHKVQNYNTKLAVYKVRK